MDVMNPSKEYSSESWHRRIKEIEYESREEDAWSSMVSVEEAPLRTAGWAFLSRREIEILGSWSRGKIATLPTWNRWEAARGGRWRTPSSGSSMKIARFTRPPYLRGIMDNVWNPPHNIRSRGVLLAFEGNNQTYLNVPAHRVSHLDNPPFCRSLYIYIFFSRKSSL